MSGNSLQYFRGAIKNVALHGDTDVFPLPIENQIFFDRSDEVTTLLFARHKDFRGNLQRYPPIQQSMLSAVGYTGLRWATQLDPIWNAYLLAMVMSVGAEIEKARIPIQKEVVFSYRFAWNREDGRLFSREVGWADFQRKSVEHAQNFASVLICDISDFYPRIYHHRLENSLKRAAEGADAVWRIMRLLTIFSKNVSYGLPVGGPAARLLSELLLNRVDRLLLSQGTTFCRFADDYHIFSQSAEESYRRLVFLSEKLLENEGLLVQKGKTRILSSDEFLSTSEFSDLNKPEDPAETATREFLRLKIHYDPYSPTGDEDYELLKAELARFDVVGMLAREIRKSRVHQTLTRKLVTAIQHVDRDQKSGAAESLIESLEELHPVVPAVMMTLKAVLPDIEEAARKSILEKLRRRFTGGSLVLAVPAHLAFSVRVLAEDDSQEADEILARIYHETSSASIKRDVILAMARRGADFWISDIKNKFATLTPWERVAVIVASYTLPGDEGHHWRKNLRDGFNDFEVVANEWAGARSSVVGWKVPI